jgi:hypothetical protein
MKPNFFFLTLLVISICSCEKYSTFDHLEVIDNSFSGSISVNESAGDIDGVFNGMSDSGTYTFIWDNPAKGAVLNVNTSPGSGIIQFVLEDSRGNEVLNQTLTTGVSNAFAEEGNKGKWKVKIVFSVFEGEGSFDLNPIQ